MANSLSELRKASSTTLEKLKQIADQQKTSSSSKDERFWSPTFNKEKGNGGAIVRLLPAPPGEDLPRVRVYSHGFKGPTGKWYIENSLSSIGKQDPVGNLNSRLWNSGVDSDKQVARDQKRKTSYYSNILVVKDPANPENEGKVFLWRYGQKIYDIIDSVMFPEDDGLGAQEGINPFDPWTGANLVIKMVGIKLGNDIVPNYDKSFFDKTSCIGTDDEIDAIWNKCESLSAFVSDKNFKTEEELKKRLYEVLGDTVGSGVQTIEGWGAAPTQVTRPSAPKEDKSSAPANIDSASSDDDDALLAELRSMLD